MTASYFDKFPYTMFSLDSDTDDRVVVRDFIRAISFRFNEADSVNLFDDYYVSDGEKLENIAYNTYGDTGYHWVLMFINGIKDPKNDLPQPDHIIREACSDIYGNLDGLHHYENANNPGEWVDFLFTPAYIVTNLDFMQAENEKKRKIKLLKPQYLSDFVNIYMKDVTK